MIRFTYGLSLQTRPELAKNMFRDRAKQFSERLQWPVTVDEKGEERDEYDSLNPLYVIVTDEFGRHQGSMRFLPTTGRTMVNDHFLHVTDGVEIASPYIWECTKFCISEHANGSTSAQLLAAGAKLMQEAGLEHFVGVFDKRMEVIYRRVGSQPRIVGESSEGRHVTGVGRWEFNTRQYCRLLKRAKLSSLEMELYIANSDIGSVVLNTEQSLAKHVA